MNDIYSVFADAYQKESQSTTKTPSLFSSSSSDLETGMKNLKNAGKLANAYNNVKNKFTGE